MFAASRSFSFLISRVEKEIIATEIYKIIRGSTLLGGHWTLSEWQL